MPKWEKLRAKATGSASHLWFPKIVEFEFVFSTNDSYCKIWSLMGENFDYGKKGEFLTLDQFYSCNISLFAQTSVFDLEIGKRIWFARTNQVVAQSDPNMPNLKKKGNWSSFALMLHFFCCFLMCWHKSPKRGDWKGNVPLGHFYKYFGD
jgi:hypothetical protein